MLKTQKFDSIDCIDGIIDRLESLIRVCDGRAMDERLAREFSIFIHELNLVKSNLTVRGAEVK